MVQLRNRALKVYRAKLPNFRTITDKPTETRFTLLGKLFFHRNLGYESAKNWNVERRVSLNLDVEKKLCGKNLQAAYKMSNKNFSGIINILTDF